MAFSINQSSIDTSISDSSITRERIYVRSNTKNRYGYPVFKDTGWDAVLYDGLPEGYEVGSDSSPQRPNANAGNLKYTGIRFVSEDDPLGTILLRSSGPGAFV